MTGLKYKRLLADYLAATRNEVAVDEVMLRLAHLAPGKVGYFPRVPYWSERARNAPSFFLAIWILCWVLWLSGGAVLFFILEFIKFNIARNGCNKYSKKPIVLTEGAVLGFSSRVCEVLNLERFPWLPSVWLTCPWAPQHVFSKGAEQLPLLSLISRGELLRSLSFALRTTYVLAFSSRTSRWALQGYTAMRWHMVRGVVDKISGTLVTTEHFDRWAVLVDRSIKSGCKKKRKLVVVQHGSLEGLGIDNSSANVLKNLPTRLSCVSDLYVYNAVEERIFLRYVLSQAHRHLPVRVRYFSPSVNLTGEQSSQHPRILFVGHPLCEEFQVGVYRSLSRSLKINAFYKPHPVAPMSASMLSIGWMVIENPRFYPYVELLVSYPSTLVIEYEGAGVLASVHPLNVDIHELPHFLNKTIEKLEKHY